MITEITCRYSFGVLDFNCIDFGFIMLSSHYKKNLKSPEKVLIHTKIAGESSDLMKISYVLVHFKISMKSPVNVERIYFTVKKCTAVVSNVE